MPVSYWDLEEDTLITLVLPDKDAPAGVNQYLLVIQLGDSGVGTVRVLADGALELDTDGEVVVRMLDENESAALSERIGIDVTGEGDIELVNEVIGDSGDNVFDMHQRSGDLLFVDTAGDDVYLSGDGDDVLLGVLPGDSDFAVRGDNRFLGGDGNDLYAGFTVGDMFYGGPGSDLAIIDGLSTDYTWIPATPQQVTAAKALDPTVTAGYVIKDKVSSAQGFLWNVEALEFNGDDRTIDLNPLVA
jgi:Ca2+-binding RTX toxin-like protein